MPGVLVVAGEALLRTLVRETLSGIPAVVFFEAEDGITALEQARRYLPKLMICDIRLPRMNGFEVCRAIKNDPALCAMLVILITAAVDAGDIAIAKMVQADGFLRKPFEEKEFVDLVLSLLQSRRT